MNWTKQIKNRNWPDADQLAILRLSEAEELNQGQPGSNPANGQSGAWTRDH